MQHIYYKNVAKVCTFHETASFIEYQKYSLVFFSQYALAFGTAIHWVLGT